MHEEKGVLEKAETESFTCVIMEQKEDLLTGTSKSSHGLIREQLLLFMYPLLRSTWARILALQPKGIRTEALTRTDEMESLNASMIKCIRGVMTGKEKINEKLPKPSGQTVQILMSLNKRIGNFNTHVGEIVFSKTCKDSGGGSDVRIIHMTGNLLKTENGNNEDTQTMSNDSLAEEKLQSAIKLTQHCFVQPDVVQRKAVHVYNIFQLVHKFAAFNAFKDGFVLQTKPKTGNLMMSEHDNSNVQVQGVRQQIDSHPPPLPPVEEEMHTKPSQHAHVHTDEDVEMSPVVLMDQVPRPLDSDDKLLDQEAIIAGNVAVGGEQASMDEAMIEGVQGQGQMVEQCGDVMVVEAGTSPSHLVCTDGLNNLLNGSNPSEGTVQVCCNDKPNKLDAIVIHVCRDLNLNYNSVVALCKTYFGPGPGSILLENAIGVQNSLNTEDVGVKFGDVKKMRKLCEVVLMENDIRLTLGSGDRYYLGLKGGCVVEVHVCRGDQYVTICADTWSNIEASCQQPGYPPYVAITVVKGVLGGTTNSISSISGFACNGAEPSLSACPVVTGASVPCSLATSGQLRDVAKAGNCTHGDIRLVMSQINGPLKACISIAWGTMCSEQVTSREVVCKQFNASKPNISVNATGAVITGAVCGYGTGPIILGQHVCTKTEQQPDMPSNLSHAQPLQQAPYGQDTNGSLVPMSTSIGTVSELTTCNHSHDARVKCEAPLMGTRWCTQYLTLVQSNLRGLSTVKRTTCNAIVAMGTSYINQAYQNIKYRSDTPAKYIKASILKATNGNNEEQHTQAKQPTLLKNKCNWCTTANHQRRTVNWCLECKRLTCTSLINHIENFMAHLKEKVLTQKSNDSADGSYTPANHMTGNLLWSEYGNNEVQHLHHQFGHTKLFDSLPHRTFWSTFEQHIPEHFHVRFTPVALSLFDAPVPVFGIPEPLIPLPGQRTQEKPLLDDMVHSDGLPDPTKPDNTFAFDLHEVGPHPMPLPSQMTDKRARRLIQVLPTGNQECTKRSDCHQLIGETLQTCSNFASPSPQTLENETQGGSDATYEKIAINTSKLITKLTSLIKTIRALFCLFLLGIPSCTNAISPSRDYTTFEKNASIFTFNCSGNGAFLVWKVDGYLTGEVSVRNKGIQPTLSIVSSDELSVSSQLIVPTTKANNNITVICVVQDLSFNIQSVSNPVKLFLQGILPPPKDLKMNISNNSVSLSWVAPDSLQVSTPPTISRYVLSNNLTNGTKTFNNPTTCNTLASCNYSLDLRDSFFTTDGNTTILDYNGAVEFTLFAVNGAGNGNATTCTLDLQRRSLTDEASHPNQTIPAAGNTFSTPASNNTTSAVHIYVTVASVCAVLGTMIVVVLVIVVCCFKRKQRTPNDSVNTTDGLSSDCPSRAIGGNTSCTPKQSTAL